MHISMSALILLNQMSMEQMLREQNYQLKNEITDLKNAFDLNRDILKIVSNYNHRSDPQQHLLMQIITRLTTVNNQAMLNSLELIQEKNVLKQENLRLNIQVKLLEDKLAVQIDNNRLSNLPNQSKMLMHEQFNSLNRQLLAANEERIAKEQQIDYWRHKYTDVSKELQENGLQCNHSSFETSTKNSKIKRKYESNQSFKYEMLLRQAHKENRKLKRYIDELENRLIVLVRSFNINLEQRPREPMREERYEAQREEVRLLKYALNDISIERKEDEYILTITERYKNKDKMNNVYLKDKRSTSWPKHNTKPQENEDDEIKFNRRQNSLNTRREEGRMQQQY